MVECFIWFLILMHSRSLVSSSHWLEETHILLRLFPTPPGCFSTAETNMNWNSQYLRDQANEILKIILTVPPEVPPTKKNQAYKAPIWIGAMAKRGYSYISLYNIFIALKWLQGPAICPARKDYSFWYEYLYVFFNWDNSSSTGPLLGLENRCKGLI